MKQTMYKVEQCMNESIFDTLKYMTFSLTIETLKLKYGGMTTRDLFGGVITATTIDYSNRPIICYPLGHTAVNQETSELSDTSYEIVDSSEHDSNDSYSVNECPGPFTFSQINIPVIDSNQVIENNDSSINNDSLINLDDDICNCNFK